MVGLVGVGDLRTILIHVLLVVGLVDDLVVNLNLANVEVVLAVDRLSDVEGAVGHFVDLYRLLV